ncbi:MAG: hypothetical protein ACPGVT_08580 [Maricaulaceae bacterium]
MSQTPAILPSLARAFEPERDRLREAVGPEATNTDMVILEARRALDRTGAAFTAQIEDPKLHRAGLWLLEMVKAGAGVLDHGTDAVISWDEIAKPKAAKWSGRALFYSAAGVFALAGFIQGSGLTILAAAVLAGFRFFDPNNWKKALPKLPFYKKSKALEDHSSGRRLVASASVQVDAAGLVDSLADALKTADHILLRLAEPEAETHWRDDDRLMGLVQGLLEANGAGDGGFALKLINQELKSVLTAEGVELVSYTKKTAHLFDALPALGGEAIQEAAPALIVGDRVIRRGTVWTPS